MAARAVGCGVVWAITVAVWCATPATAAEKALWGPTTLPHGGSAFPVYRDLGVDTLQLVLNWRDTAGTRPGNPRDPSDPAYSWSPDLETAVREGASHGIEIALVVTSSPAWANGGRAGNWAPAPEALADFLVAASQRYAAVRRWMIWSEPNDTKRFRPGGVDSPEGPRAYAVILDSAYAALKSVSSRNIVIGPMTWTGGDVKPASWLRWMRLPNGRPPRLDWYGHNPYPFRRPNTRQSPLAGGWRDMSDMHLFAREVARTYRGSGIRPRLWLSEYGVQSERRSDVFELHVTPADQAAWLTDGYAIADRSASVAGLGWFYFLDEPDGRGSGLLGLMTRRGERKPSFLA